uniref:Uncharacterized protein n=1 Tax=Anguilla anguilla TaxID=7936 RepID=A0A0E9UEV1_ANGAN
MFSNVSSPQRERNNNSLLHVRKSMVQTFCSELYTQHKMACLMIVHA